MPSPVHYLPHLLPHYCTRWTCHSVLLKPAFCLHSCSCFQTPIGEPLIKLYLESLSCSSLFGLPSLHILLSGFVFGLRVLTLTCKWLVFSLKSLYSHQYPLYLSMPPPAKVTLLSQLTEETELTPSHKAFHQPQYRQQLQLSGSTGMVRSQRQRPSLTSRQLSLLKRLSLPMTTLPTILCPTSSCLMTSTSLLKRIISPGDLVTRSLSYY